MSIDFVNSHLDSETDMITWFYLLFQHVVATLLSCSSTAAFTPVTTTGARQRRHKIPDDGQRNPVAFFGLGSRRVDTTANEENLRRSSSSSPSSDFTNMDTTINATHSTSILDSVLNESPPSTIYDGMPWGDIQEWALRDKAKHYTVTAPLTVEGSNTFHSFVLWRTLSQDVPELAGYPISFLANRYASIAGDPSFQCPPNASYRILPYLDDFVFESNGGLSGRIYGMMGLADGTRIQTAPVANVEVTLPKSFVQTADGQTMYEIGNPGTESPTAINSFKAPDMVLKTSSVALKEGGASSIEKGEPLVDPDLLNLAGLTTIAIAGAYAFETLSHHLTVNVFWV